MADMEAFERDLRIEVRKLPPKLIAILKDLAMEFGPTLDQIFGPAFERLKPHIMAIFVLEMPMGLVDKEELNELIVRVLKETEQKTGG